MATELEMVSFHSNPKEGQYQKYSNYCTIALISPANKVKLKIIQARLQRYVKQGPPYVQAGLRKGRGTGDQIANIRWIIETAKELQKKSNSASLTMLKLLTVWIITHCGKFLQR